MTVEDWMQAQAREEKWEEQLRHLPVCVDCGKVIRGGMVFPLEEDGSCGCLCPACMVERMISTEELE